MMGRQKVKLQLLANDSMRRTTFKKRRAGLLKKLNELATLCGVVACAVIFGQHDDQPVTWPSPAEAATVLHDLRNLPANRKGKYMMDQEAFLRRSIHKLRQELEKERIRNTGLETDLIMNLEAVDDNYSKHLSLDNLKELVNVLGERIETISGFLGVCRFMYEPISSISSCVISNSTFL